MKTKNKKKKIIIIIFSLLASLLAITAIVVPTTLYFTIWKKPAKNDDVQPPVTDLIDLSKENFSYLAHVIEMNKITDQEATTIKTDIRTEINKKLSNLNLTENIDYKIENLDQMKSTDNLNDYLDSIIINSLAASNKTTGNFSVILNAEENITTRIIRTIEVDAKEENGLSEDAAHSITNQVIIRVQTLLSQGQINQQDIDYQIINLNLIAAGAKFTDYSNQVKVRGISNHLTGEFIVNFALV